MTNDRPVFILIANMNPTEIVYAVLKKFTQKNRTHLVPLFEFLHFFKNYIEQDDTGQFDLFTTNTQDAVSAQLIILEEKGRCSIFYRGDRIESVVFTDYFLSRIQEEYRRLEVSSEEPFPSEDSCKLEIPSDMIRAVDIKNDFIDLLSGEIRPRDLIRILFPGDVKNILITGQLLQDRLLILCLQRIQEYLNSKNNSNYLFRKLSPILKQSEQAVLDMINKARNSPTQMSQQIKAPTEVTFPFWAQMSNFIIKELKEKNDKLPRDNTYCQSAYLIGYFNIYYRDQVHKEKEKEVALRSLGDRLRKPPYAFSLLDIFSFRDGKTVLLDNKYSREQLVQFLEEKTTPGTEDLLPEIVRIRTAGRKEYYLHRDIIVALCFKKVNDAHDHYRKQYLDQWHEDLREFRKNSVMTDDEAFHKDLENRIREEDPLLDSLLNYDLLYLAVKRAPNAPTADDVYRYLNTKQKALYSLEEILRLHRKDLAAEARRGLPFWRFIPVLSSIIIFFQKMKRPARPGREKDSPRKDQNLQGRSVQEEGTAGSRAEEQKQKEIFRKQIYRLKEEFVGKGVSIEGRLGELAEKWNPLYDPKAKANLVEDVNCLVRDYLRSIKRGLLLSPPDSARIRNMAALLVRNKALEKIPKKDILENYLEIYLIFLLQQKKMVF